MRIGKGGLKFPEQKSEADAVTQTCQEFALSVVWDEYVNLGRKS